MDFDTETYSLAIHKLVTMAQGGTGGARVVLHKHESVANLSKNILIRAQISKDRLMVS